MFNNAGIALNGKFEDFELKHWRKTIDINLMGVVYGADGTQIYVETRLWPYCQYSFLCRNISMANNDCIYRQ